MTRVLAGRYELEVALGRGGSGEVWRAKDMAAHRPVAVKLIELAEIDDPGLLAETIGRFRREAVVVARLRHPNIVAALDAGRIGNELFLVMELAQGISLASMLDQREARGMGLLPVSSVLGIAGQACAGLAAAHTAGVVHRDIKPSNLMVTARLHIKIIDFGIARLLTDNSPRLTLPAHTVGTLAYISPEQARGANVDGRADLYSLGCVLYELLTGRPPFHAGLPEQLVMMHVLDQPVPLSIIRPGLPAGLPELVSGLLEKDRDARPADAAEVISRIEAISGVLGSDVPVNEADRGTVRADDPATIAAPVRMMQRAAGPPGPVPQAPPAAGGKNGGTPEWPTVPRSRPRRRRWRRTASTLITAAIAVGVGIYVWAQAHETLQVTAAAVAVARQPAGCDVTVNIIGTISTNGRGGPISYQWIRGSGKNAPVLVAAAASGHNTVRVELNWAFHGKGTDRAVAEFRVLKPQQAAASTTFTYSCRS